jgi:hypothetical protein
MVQQGKRGIGLWIGSLVLLASSPFLGGMVGEGRAAEPFRAQPAPGRGAATDPTTPVPSGVVVKGGKLSVSLQGARFQDVMEAISLQGGIEISVVGGAGQTTLTESFRGLPLEEGLVSLLRDKNFAFVYSNVEGERRVSRVIVTPRRSGQHPEAPPSTTVFRPESMPSTLDTLGTVPVQPPIGAMPFQSPIPPSPGVVAPLSVPPNVEDPTLPMETTGLPQTSPLGAQRRGPEGVR